MKFWDIVRSVGGGIIENVVPGGNVIMGVINGLLPADKQFPVNATGLQVQDAINTLPAELQAEVKYKEFDVTLEQIKQSHDTLRTMLVSDATSSHTTRPKIAIGAFRVVAFTIIIAVSTWAYAVLSDNPALVRVVMDGWGFLLAVLAPLVTLLHAYFGVLKQEKKATLDASNGQPVNTSVVGSLINRVLKR